MARCVSSATESELSMIMRRPSSTTLSMRLALLLLLLQYSASAEMYDDDDDDDASVAIYGAVPRDAEWLPAWLGIYDLDASIMLHGRPSYTKRGDGFKLLFFTGSYWHFGHPHDVSSGAAMIAAVSQAGGVFRSPASAFRAYLEKA